MLTPGCTAHALIDARQKVENDIAQICQSIQALKTQRNLLCAINSLPPEVLAHVFSFVVRREVRCDRKLGWIQSVAHVCRRWREIAFNCPRLWGTIDYSSVERTEMMLSLAKNTPLTVLSFPYESIREDVDLPGLTLLLSPANIFKIEKLRLFATVNILQKLAKLLQGCPAPMLKRLLLTNNSSYTTVRLPDALFRGEMSSLEYVHFTRCRPLRWSLLPMLRNVTYFGLFLLAEGERPEMQDWLELLRSLPNVVYLRVAQAIPLYPAERQSTENTPTVAPDAVLLPNLKILDIDASDSYFNNVQGLAYTLSHMIMPSLSHFEVVCGHEEIDDGRTFSLAPLCPLITLNCWTKSQILDSQSDRDKSVQISEPLRSIVVEQNWINHAFHIIAGWTDPDTAALFRHKNIHNLTTTRAKESARVLFSFGDEVWGLSNENTLKENVEEVLGALPLGHVQTLTVDTTIGMLDDVRWWTSVHGMFAQLQTLYLSGRGTADMFLFAFINIDQVPDAVSPDGNMGHTLIWLAKNTLDPDIAPTNASNNTALEKREDVKRHHVTFTADNIIFPRLKSLHISAFTTLPSLSYVLDGFVDALAARRALGAPIENLEFEKDSGPVFRRYIPRLREIVPVIVINGVSYDGKGSLDGDDDATMDVDVDADDEEAGDEEDADDEEAGDEEDADDEEAGDEEDADDDMAGDSEEASQDSGSEDDSSEDSVCCGIYEPGGSLSMMEAREVDSYESGDSDDEWPGIRGSRS